MNQNDGECLNPAENGKEALFTNKQFTACFPYATKKNIDQHYEHMVEACEKYEINTPKRLSNFFAQLAHESGSLRYKKELASGEAYDTGRLAKALGNTPEKDGDGQKYKGRGLIQITGTTNYRAVGFALGVDFLNNPHLLEQPKYAVLSAAWYWDSRSLNVFADKMDYKTITRRINGGYNGLQDRLKYLEICKKVFGLS